MRSLEWFVKAALSAMIFSMLSLTAMGQSISGVQAVAPDQGQTEWRVEVSFVPDPGLAKIRRIFLVDIEDERIIRLSNPTASGSGIYSFVASEPLDTVVEPKSGLKLAKHYELKASLDNPKGDKILSVGGPVELLREDLAMTTEVRQKAKDVDDADVYISGELNGAHKKKTSFTTEIKLQKYKPLSPSWRWTPFFKLNASTDAGADPDKMEAGVDFRYILTKTKAYFDNEFKLESERDFDNTNLIYGARLTFLPDSWPKGFKKKGRDGKITINDVKVFFNPFIGTELGKNLDSPLKAAQGDGIARVLAGADLRVAFFIKKNQKAPDINWTTSFTRRWLLTDELGFKTDDNGDLQLRTFGTSPRDHFLSKFSYKMNKFFDVFTAYEWGQVPPSYKLVDHRFRLGFAYKFKFGLE
jgi:hypothetical protein